MPPMITDRLMNSCLITCPLLRPIIADQDGKLAFNPKMEKYLNCPDNAEKFERIFYRYKIRLLFKKIQDLTRKTMCYSFSFAQNIFHLKVNLSMKKARRLGLELSYSGKTIREIYESLREDLSELLYKINIAIAIHVERILSQQG